MRRIDLNHGAVLALLKDADGFLALSEIDVSPGPPLVTMVVNLRSGCRGLTRRGIIE
jgi:hypothetical protein